MFTISAIHVLLAMTMQRGMVSAESNEYPDQVGKSKRVVAGQLNKVN